MDIKIGKKIISKHSPVFVIAEIGVNHNGDIKVAKKMIDVACEAGVDAVKFQTFTAELLVTNKAAQADYQSRNTGVLETQYQMLKRLELSHKDFFILKKYCEKKEVVFLSTPFSEVDADFLDSLKVYAYKISSGDLNNFPFLKHVAKKKSPMLVATGMASMAEVLQAQKIIRAAGNNEVVFLHCTSNYPASPRSLNLRAIKKMQEKLGTLIGYSDHSQGYVADVLAVAMGAKVIEKHFTLDKNMTGPDHRASVDAEELRAMVKAIRDAEDMLAGGAKVCMVEEKSAKLFARKSVVAKKFIAKGEKIDLAHIIMKRPGNGIPPTKLNLVVGKRAKKDILPDSLIKIADLL